MGDEDGNNMDHTSGYEKSGVRPTGWGIEALLSELSPARLGVLSAVLGMVNWLAHKILSSPSFAWWIPISSHLSLSRPELYPHIRTRSYFIPLNLCMQWVWVNTEYSIHRVLHSPSTVHTVYCIHSVPLHPKIDCLPLPASLLSLISWLTLLYSILCIPTITT